MILPHFTRWIDGGRDKPGSISQKNKAMVFSGISLLGVPKWGSFSFRKLLTKCCVT
jgi:hypothetical protein